MLKVGDIVYIVQVPDDPKNYKCDQCDLQAHCDALFGHKGKGCVAITYGLVYREKILTQSNNSDGEFLEKMFNGLFERLESIAKDLHEDLKQVIDNTKTRS